MNIRTDTTLSGVECDPQAASMAQLSGDEQRRRLRRHARMVRIGMLAVSIALTAALGGLAARHSDSPANHPGVGVTLSGRTGHAVD